MPLAFESNSHGTVAFGFFNIESDMLLLDRYFFFATDFCEAICKMVMQQDEAEEEILFSAYAIHDRAGVGDLHGGIAGTHYSGFIGETYKKYPFPKDPTKFKQQTEGFITREGFTQMILQFGVPIDCALTKNSHEVQVSIGPYVFSQQNFPLLIEYVIKGGYPGWQDAIAPDYVQEMRGVVKLR